MNLRTEIEQLLIWYIPIFLLSSILASVASTYVKSFNGEPIALTSLVIVISFFISYLANIVVGIWLYSIAKRCNQRYILWSLFGFVANIIAVALFIGLYIYEEYKNHLNSTMNDNVLY